jgi:hypothetical protein
MIKLFRMGIQTCNDVPQTLSLGELPKTHAQKLVPAWKVSHPDIATILFNMSCKALSMDQLHDLGENIDSFIHEPSLLRAILIEIRHIQKPL